jgi:ribulose-phosphate 3-epimerase
MTVNQARTIAIAPSILSADFGRLAHEVQAVTAAGADYIHVDVMDGHFVPNMTFGPVVLEAVRRATTLPLDVHLMIENADRWIADYAKAGADLIGVHAEACPHLHRTIGHIAELGKKPVVVINPATSLESIRWVLPDVAMVLLMTVNPGFGGQRFIATCLEKITMLRRMIDDKGLDVDIEVDGGIKADNIAAAAAAGANVFVAGSAVFSSNDYRATIAELRKRAVAAY